MDNETTTAEYRVRVERWAWLQEQVAKLNRRAAKLGVAPVTLTVVGTETRKHEDGFGVDEYNVVRVEGVTPKLAGWRLLATLQHVEGATIIAAVPGAVAEGELAAYRGAAPKCDHCRTARPRLDTYLLRHEDGRMAQVGSSCLADFLGGADPKALASAAGYLLAIRAACEDAEGWGGGSGPSGVYLAEFLTATATAIRTHGWLSKSAARERGDYSGATADLVWEALTDLKTLAECKRIASYRECRVHLHEESTEADEAAATAALEWARGLTAEAEASGRDLTDYQYNIAAVAARAVLDYRHAGLAASIVSSHQRVQDRERERAAERAQAAASVYVGTVGKRQDFVLTVLSSRELDSDWGVTTLYLFADAAGNRLKWFASGAGQMEDGHTYTVKGTVKSHDEYKGVAQTQLTRCKVLGEVTAASAA